MKKLLSVLLIGGLATLGCQNAHSTSGTAGKTEKSSTGEKVQDKTPTGEKKMEEKKATGDSKTPPKTEEKKTEEKKK